MLFWGTRASLKWDQKWHWCGTFLFHVLHSPLFLCFALNQWFDIPFTWLSTFRETVVSLVGVTIYGGLLIVDVVVYGIRKFHKRLKQYRMLPRNEQAEWK